MSKSPTPSQPPARPAFFKNLSKNLKRNRGLKWVMRFSLVLATLIFLEGLVSTSVHFWTPLPTVTTLQNQNDIDQKAIQIPAHWVQAIAPQIIKTIQQNPLTHADPDTFYRVRPNPSTLALNGFKGINTSGFRGNEVRLARSRNHDDQRVLLIGGSTAFGVGIKDYYKTIAFGLSKQLNGGSQHYQFYNLAQPGFSTAQSQTLALPWIKKLKPHLVILMVEHEDFESTPGWSDRVALHNLKRYRDLKASRWPDWIMQWRLTQWLLFAQSQTLDPAARSHQRVTSNEFALLVERIREAHPEAELILVFPHRKNDSVLASYQHRKKLLETRLRERFEDKKHLFYDIEMPEKYFQKASQSLPNSAGIGKIIGELTSKLVATK